MDNYCFLKINKFNTHKEVGKAILDSLKWYETEHKNDSICKLDYFNNYLPFNVKDVKSFLLKRYKSLLPSKYKEYIYDNKIRAVKVLFTASHTAFQNINKEEYLNECDKWAKKTFGEENIFFISHYHLKTPISAVFMVPKDNNSELNCNYYFGKNGTLSELRTKFVKDIGEKFDLKRKTSHKKGNSIFLNELQISELDKIEDEVEIIEKSNNCNLKNEYLIKKWEKEIEIKKIVDEKEIITKKIIFNKLTQKTILAMSNEDRNNYLLAEMKNFKAQQRKITAQIYARKQREKKKNRSKINHAKFILFDELFKNYKEELRPFILDISNTKKYCERTTNALNMLMQEQEFIDIVFIDKE